MISLPFDICRGFVSRRLRALSTLVLIAALVAAAAVASVDRAHGAEVERIETWIVADVTSIEAGKSFRVGVYFEIADDHHIYWHTPGDVGYATEVDWSAPEGFEFGPLQWPEPEKFDEQGFTSYGYLDEILLFSEATAPAGLEADTEIEIAAAALWLVCKSDGQCVPGEIALTLTLSTGNATASEEAGLFEKFAALVPVEESVEEPEVKEPKPVETPKPTVVEPIPTVEPEPTKEPTLEPKVVEPKPVVEPEPTQAPTPEPQVKEKKPEPTPTPEPVEEAPIPAEPDKPSDGGPVFSFLADYESPTKNISMAKLLFFAFIGGLLLNVMPCVLPVLSIKILSFVRQADEDPKRILRLGLVFALGVFVSFAAMATLVVVIQSAGTQLGWGFQFMDPRFTILMSAVIFVFGLSLFDVFTINLPGSAVQTADGLQRREGPAGAFFNGVLATMLATPCTAPLLGPALGFAFTQSGPIVYVFFLTIAAGLSTPYVLLSAKPGWIKFIPKPGPWMETFKQLMGFLLMATVIWLLWAMKNQVGAEGIVWTLVFLMGLGVGCWLIGLGFDLRGGIKKRVAAVVAFAVLAGGGYSFPEKHLRLMAEASVDVVEIVNSGEGIQWQPFSVGLIEKLAAEEKTIFIDFTADWCLTCKVNEKIVLSTQTVADAFEQYGVEAVIADYTNQPPVMTQVIRSFGRAGVPLYVIFPAGRPDEPIVLPEVLTISMVVDNLAKAAQ